MPFHSLFSFLHVKITSPCVEAKRSSGRQAKTELW